MYNQQWYKHGGYSNHFTLLFTPCVMELRVDMENDTKVCEGQKFVSDFNELNEYTAKLNDEHSNDKM